MAHIEERTGPDGRKKYRAQIRLKGFPSQSATFDRKTDAKKWAQQTESAMLEGRHFKTIEAKRHTIGEMIDRYVANVLPKKADGGYNQKLQFVWWKNEIGNYTLADATPALIAECRDKLLEDKTHLKIKRSPATVNRYLAALSHCFNVAVKEWGWIDDNPMRKVQKNREPRGRVRFLDDDERARLLQACQQVQNPYLYMIVVLALSTGARRGEILNLKWGQVDINRKLITLYETKNNEVRSLPLTGHALHLMKNLNKVRRIDTDYLFPAKNKLKPVDIKWAWQKALTIAEIQNFRFHDLRHSAASYLAMNGATLAEIANILGHKTLQMVKRYSHLTDQHTAKVVAKMNQQIFST